MYISLVSLAPCSPCTSSLFFFLSHQHHPVNWLSVLSPSVHPDVAPLTVNRVTIDACCVLTLFHLEHDDDDGGDGDDAPAVH